MMELPPITKQDVAENRVVAVAWEIQAEVIVNAASDWYIRLWFAYTQREKISGLFTEFGVPVVFMVVDCQHFVSKDNEVITTFKLKGVSSGL